MNSAPVLDLITSKAGASVCLNIGGRETRIPGFLNVDLQDLPTTDILDDISTLHTIKDATISEIYASHVLEHFIWTKTLNVLRTWRRVLKKGGVAYMAVPDWDVIVRLYQSDGLSPYLIELIYGEPDKQETFGNHYNVFNYARLGEHLTEAGFEDVERIQAMPYDINDCSKLRENRGNRLISLMVKATA